MTKDGRLAHALENEDRQRRALLIGALTAALCMMGAMAAQAAPAETAAAPSAEPEAASAKPNIVVIFGDDIGITNVSAYSFGLMGYKTPNIDRIANEGMMFTDYYAEQSCTAGRSSFITGQATLRTGLQGRATGGGGRAASRRHHHRPGAEAARLCNRAIRQEPSRRPQRVSANGARLR